VRGRNSRHLDSEGGGAAAASFCLRAANAVLRGWAFEGYLRIPLIVRQEGRFRAASSYSVSQRLDCLRIGVRWKEPDSSLLSREANIEGFAAVLLVRFIDADKAVLEVEYKLDRADFCAKAQALGFSSMKKRLSLGPWRRAR
jgi:hypothetical protein